MAAEIDVIQLQSLAFGSFAEAEPLNPRFSAGHPKLRLTVDSESIPRLADRDLLEELARAFPGLAGHFCQMSATATDGEDDARGIVLLDGEPSANQAHLLEHLVLEMLSYADRLTRLSGVTCAYSSPPERNDIFVECVEAGSGRFICLLAVDAMNAALGGSALAPLYPDALRCAREMLHSGAFQDWAPGDMARLAQLSADRAAAALEIFQRLGVVIPEAYTMNFSGEPHYRFVGGCRSAPPGEGLDANLSEA